MVSMLFPRRESCSRFGKLVRCLIDDREEISLCSSFREVMEAEMGVEIVEIWFVETDNVVSDGNWYVKVDICHCISSFFRSMLVCIPHPKKEEFHPNEAQSALQTSVLP